MTARQVLAEIRERRIPVRQEGGHIFIPRALLTPELAAGITANKPELLWLLERRLEPGPGRPEWEVWLLARHWEEWRLLEHRFWRKDEDAA